MKINLKIVSAIVLCIGTCAIAPKIVASTENLTILTAKGFSNSNSQNVKNIYVPPNYGGPDSQNGSGTR